MGALLNQALCSQKLAESVEENQAKNWEDLVRVCTLLIQRHFEEQRPEGTRISVPETTAMIIPALKSATASADSAAWATKAHYRRALAREKLCYVADAVRDLEVAHRLAPDDSEVSKRLALLRQRQQRVELQPKAMFKDVLQRERDECEREAAKAALEEKKRRKE